MKINLNKVELKFADTDDPIAQKIEWLPVRPGGANFKTRTVRQIDGAMLVIETSAQLKKMLAVFGAVFFAAALVIVSHTDEPNPLIPYAVVVFITLVIVALVFSVAPVTDCLDLSSRTWFRKGPPIRNRFSPPRFKPRDLDRVHALQIIPEYISGDSDSAPYKSYELNVVFKDCTRFNLIDHGDLDALRRDAETIAQFLAVPIWDAS